MSRQVSQCVANSLGWYEAVLRAHGIAGAVTSGVWACRERVPPYYSNAVTADASDPAAQIEILRELEAAIGRPFSVKDSFAILDLAPLGFRQLFDAEWIWRDPSLASPERERREVDWCRIDGEAPLGRWEAAWRDSGSPAEARVFLPDLLTSGDVVLLAARRGEAIVAGCAVNRTPGVVGFSNFFCADADWVPLMASAVAETIRVAPGLPVVGYARGDLLDAARQLGFSTAGPLRVWLAE